jgi:DNA-binding MarR family transcriptional regulator
MGGRAVAAQHADTGGLHDGETAGDDELASDGRRMLTVSARLFRIQQQNLAGLDEPLTFRQFRILARVKEGTGSAGVLGRRMRLAPATVSQSVDGLVRRGLLHRATSAEDRRTRVLTLTPDGEAALAAAEAEMSEVGGQIMQACPPEIRPYLPELLERVHEIATAWLDRNLGAGVEGDVG